MLIIPPPQFRKGQPKPKKNARLAPALLLVAATFTHDTGTILHLTFDRAIDIAAIDVSQFIVDDAFDLGLKLRGRTPAALEGPASVRVLLEEIGDATGTGTTLTVAANNGIVAVDDAAAWAGAEDLGLPFP